MNALEYYIFIFVQFFGIFETDRKLYGFFKAILVARYENSPVNFIICIRTKDTVNYSEY